jgi:hypothetical protein
MSASQVFARVAAATIAAVTVGAIANFSVSIPAVSIPLKDGDNITGLIRSTSTPYRFTNPSKPGSPLQSRGEEHTFTAQRGDSVEISITPEEGSALKPILVLFDPSNRQVFYNENPSFVKYQIVRPGTYRLLIVGRNASLGRYSLAIDGLSNASAPMAQADQVMQNILKLRPIGCGIPNVAKIRIGAEERCTRDIEAGTYTYDETAKSIKLVDTRRDLLAKQLQLNILDRCPFPATSVAQITMADPQDGKDYTYCATPNRYLQAGNYRYNSVSDTLTPITSTATNSPVTTSPVTTSPVTTSPVTTSPPTNASVTTTPDAKRQLLQTEYGLTVLDNCPAGRTSYVVVNFPEGNQIYQYCANPNRLVRAGEYSYNAKTGALDPVSQPVNCTVTIGGVCILK